MAEPLRSMRSYQLSYESTESYELDGVSVIKEAYYEKWDELYDPDEYIVIGYDDVLDMVP